VAFVSFHSLRYSLSLFLVNNGFCRYLARRLPRVALCARVPLTHTARATLRCCPAGPALASSSGLHVALFVFCTLRAAGSLTTFAATRGLLLPSAVSIFSSAWRVTAKFIAPSTIYQENSSLNILLFIKRISMASNNNRHDVRYEQAMARAGRFSS
jgi:hypothetical protein